MQASNFDTLPKIDDDLSAWDTWDGTSEITATNGYYIAVAETEPDFSCEKVGKTQVVSRIESNITYMDGSSVITGLTPTTYLEGIGAVLPNATKQGYRFEGWYANAELTGDVIAEIGTSATGNKTFYAKFTELPDELTTTINTSGNGQFVDISLSVSPALTEGNKYKIKTYANEQAFLTSRIPALNEDLSDWLDFELSDFRMIMAGIYGFGLAEVDTNNRCKKYGLVPEVE